MRTIHTVTTESEDKVEYYEEDESLVDAQERYYGEAESPSKVDRMTRAVFAGTLAQEEQLEGHVAREEFKSLFKGVLPGSDQRIRAERPNPDDKERLAHDVVLSAPKSVSMALHLEGDLRLFDAHMEAAKETLGVIEQEFAQTRIQVNGVRQTVHTGKLLAVLMPHHTSREGDMQLHTHMLIMNGTKAPDGIWRSLCHEALANAEWIGSLYRQRLAEKVQGLGYRIYNTEHGFELQGYSRDEIEVFSKRNRSIVQAVKAEGLSVNAETKKQKVLPTRKAKCKSGKKLEEIQNLWRTEAHSQQVGQSVVEHPITVQPEVETAVNEVNSAIRHLSERAVSFSRGDIYAYAHRHIHAEGLALEQINQTIDQHKSLINIGDGRFTTAEALEREIETIQRWMSGQGNATPLLTELSLEGSGLNPGQTEAIQRTLTSTDKHQIIHGLAGVGKTKALGELARQLRRTEVQVRGFSPTIDAAAELQKSLGIQTNTVEHLVLSKPELVPNQLWIIDEAGMTSSRQMQAIERKADSVGARILLVGDKGQNSSVEAGSPLRSLISHGATTHSIRQIIRQQNPTQKQAVELIAEGKGSAALELLHQKGYVSELANRKDRATAIANQYFALSEKERDKTLIVTGTNAERLTITKVLRAGLKQEGKLGNSVKVGQLVSRQFTIEQSRQIRNYQAGDYIKLHRDYQSTPLKKGQLYKVEERKGDELVVSSYGGRLYRFNPSQYKDKEVFYAQQIEIDVGDKMRWTATEKEQRRVNGKQFTVSAIEGTSMSILDSKGKTQEVSLLQPLSVDYNLVSTSYRAQSKSQKRVIVSATSDPTSAREPFYVKISRQFKELSVYTQDLEQLRAWVKRSNAQENPLDLIGEHHERRNYTNPNIGRHSDTAYPNGGADQRHRPQVQPVPAGDSGAAERLCGALSRIAIEETLGGLRTTIAGLNRVHQQLHQRASSRNDLTREIRRLSEAVGSADQAPSRATEQQLTRAIQQEQVSEAIRQPLLGLKEVLHKVKAIKPTDSRPLVELVATLQQTVSQMEQRTSKTIKDEKLNILADAIAQWKADSAVTEDLRVQQISKDINALHASAEVLRSQRVATSIHQTRAEHYIHAALQEFNQAVSQGMNSLRAGTRELESTLTELRSLLDNRVEVADQMRQLAQTAGKLGLSTTPRPNKVEVFWQPTYSDEPPPHITQTHWEEFKASAIHPDLIKLNAQSISDYQVYERLLSDKLATMGSGQFVTAQMAREMKKYEQIAQGGWWGDAGIDALSLINLKPGEEPTLSTWGCYKPDNPRIDHRKTQAKGKTEFRKYENPVGTGRVPFLAQVPDWLAEKIYQKYNVNPTEAERQSGFWFVVKQHPQIPITITEGFKKDLASLSQGEVTIGLTGTNHIYRARDSQGNQLPQRQLNEAIAVFAQPGREFRFAYDQDSKTKTIRNVRRDLVRGVELLEAKGCTSKVIKWNHEGGKGLDDLIANLGPKAYSIAQRCASSAARDKQTHYRTEYNSIARKVRSELGNISTKRLDLEVYLRTIQKGEASDGSRVVGESDTARLLRKRSHGKEQGYMKAIASVAGTYKRLSDRNVDDIDEVIRKVVQQLEIEQTRHSPHLSQRHGPKL